MLPKFNNQPYIRLDKYNHFGLIDLVGSSILGKFDIKQWYDHYHSLKRQFSVKTDGACEVLYLDLNSLNGMSTEFPEDFSSIFNSIS